MMQPVMRAPLIDFSLSALGWFNLIYGFAAVSMVVLMSIHTRRRIAIVPTTWLGRGQLLFFILIWTFVIGNLGKALAGFGEQRLLTEGVIFINSVLATLLILLVPSEEPETSLISPEVARTSFISSIGGAVLFLVISAAVIPPIETFTIRSIYGDAYAGGRGKNFRFGPKANWKHAFHVKGQPEKPAQW
jgi:hypothetical protein